MIYYGILLGLLTFVVLTRQHIMHRQKMRAMFAANAPERPNGFYSINIPIAPRSEDFEDLREFTKVCEEHNKIVMAAHLVAWRAHYANLMMEEVF